MRNPRTILTSLALTAASIIIVSAFWMDNLLLSALLTALLAFALWFWHTRSDIIHFLIAAIAGPLTEAVCIYFGAWNYSNPTFLIPFWLPLLWGLAGISLYRFSTCFTKGGSS